jgi:hypothetical protein
LGKGLDKETKIVSSTLLPVAEIMAELIFDLSSWLSF